MEMLSKALELARLVDQEYRYDPRARGMLAAWRKAAEAITDAEMQRMVTTTDASLRDGFQEAVEKRDRIAWELLSEACAAMAQTI